MMYRMKRRAMCRTEKPAPDGAALKTALLSLFTATLAAVTAAAMGLGTALAQDAPNLAPGAGPATGQSALAEQGVLKSQHGDWRILCEAAAGPGAERCALVQNVESADRPGFGLVVMILKTPDDKTRMRVAAPLGIFLPPGLGLRVDGEEVGNAPFWFCRPYACETEAVLTDQIMERLRQGREALFVLFERPEKGTGLIVSLNGFSVGHQALGTWRPPVDTGAEPGADPAPAPAPAAT